MSTSNQDEERSYHHGDLRNTLVKLGTQMLQEGGEAGLSLRKLAQRAGVSHNAPYQHFADKNELIAAIAEEGFRLLSDYIEQAVVATNGQPAQERLASLGAAYVAFALAHSSHLQVMFGPYASSAYPDLASASHRTLGRFIATVHDIQDEEGLRARPSEDVALLIWMVVHGLSAILIADKIPDVLRDDRTPEALTRQFMVMIYQGLRA